mmetsp:Transcript_4944/g.11113  ORF Transcript_4944/g.11113 Transcript_4944/m.11113 type:complete len:215 (-) Transcript_4944:728-1372(-)
MRGTSIPRAATSVTTRMGHVPFWKDRRFFCLASLSMLPYICVVLRPVVFRSRVRYSTWWRVAAKIKVSPRFDCLPTCFTLFCFFLFFDDAAPSSSTSSSSAAALAPVVSVPCISGRTSLTRCSSTASFSALLHVTNPIRSSSLTCTSESSLTTVGSCIMPVFVNSTRARGIVALKSMVCLLSGIFEHICRNCMANPISKSRSASSNTTTSHCLR